MIDNQFDALDSEPLKIRGAKLHRRPRRIDGDRRYTVAVRAVERINARLGKREERGSWR